jgi:predicted dehydrogenase
MKVGIVGSGFGLYGYLPAILRGCGEHVLLAEKYRSQLLAREDVASLAESIEWLRDESSVLDAANAVVIARRPEDQFRVVGDCLVRSNIERLLLEKPLAHNPEAAESLIRELLAARRTFRIGYTFRYTRWFREVLSVYASKPRIGPASLRWRFCAHHHRTGVKTWKRQVMQGGGAVRFFGIHVIAFLAELGYDTVSFSEVSPQSGPEADCWYAKFDGPALPAFYTVVETNSAVEEFHINYGEALVDLPDPFSIEETSGKFDRRVDVLTQLCSEFLYDDVPWLPWYEASIQLWSEVEKHTRRVSRRTMEVG